jgi:hypothetical protein
MMAIELEPLNKERIDELGLTPHDLWVVRMGEDIYGPFEGQVLKDYAAQNEEGFDDAEATRLENNDWQPFFSHALFQRRSPQVIKAHSLKLNGPYWLLVNGMKVGPIQKMELDKRLELGSIGLTDLISADEGHSWMKIFQLPGLDRRFHNGSELPKSPNESDFQKARLEILEKIEMNSTLPKTSDELAEMAYSVHTSAKVLEFKKENHSLDSLRATAIDPQLKWPIALGISCVITLFIGVGFLLSGNPQEIAEDTHSTESEEKVSKEKSTVTRNLPPPEAPFRKPASTRSYEKEESPYIPEYREDLEVHQNEPPPEAEPIEEVSGEAQENEIREPASNEESLVTPPVQSSEQNLDEVMTGNPPPVEEASDL